MCEVVADLAPPDHPRGTPYAWMVRAALAELLNGSWPIDSAEPRPDRGPERRVSSLELCAARARTGSWPTLPGSMAPPNPRPVPPASAPAQSILH